MAMSFKRILAVGFVAFAVTGCGFNQQIGTGDLGLGEAVKYDTALQTINPTPVYPANAAQPGASGALGAAAAKRYRTGTVKSIEQIQTTSGTSGSSMSASSSTP